MERFRTERGRRCTAAGSTTAPLGAAASAVACRCSSAAGSSEKSDEHQCASNDVCRDIS